MNRDNTPEYGTFQKFIENYVTDFAKQRQYKIFVNYLKYLKTVYNSMWDNLQEEFTRLQSDLMRNEVWMNKWEMFQRFADDNERIVNFINREIEKELGVEKS